MEIKTNSYVCYLSDYDFYYGTVEYVGKKIKINRLWPVPNAGKIYDRISPEKVCSANAQVCVVWETWKGVNGRGAYRIENTLYPKKHKQAYDLRSRGDSSEWV